MTQSIRSSPTRARHPYLAAAAALLGLVGCAELDPTDPTDTPDTENAALARGSLAATPISADFGRVIVGRTAGLAVTLTNRGTTEIIINNVAIGYPPDPYVPPDPYHNPPGDLTARLIVPCVRPGASTTLQLTFAPTAVEDLVANVDLSYTTSTGLAYRLTVPASGWGIAP